HRYDTDVHCRKYQCGIFRKSLVSADIKINVAKIQQAEHQTGNDVASSPLSATNRKPDKAEYASQYERNEQAAGERCAAFRHLLEQNVGYAIPGPDAEQCKNGRACSGCRSVSVSRRTDEQ